MTGDSPNLRVSIICPRNGSKGRLCQSRFFHELDIPEGPLASYSRGLHHMELVSHQPYQQEGEGKRSTTLQSIRRKRCVAVDPRTGDQLIVMSRSYTSDRCRVWLRKADYRNRTLEDLDDKEDLIVLKGDLGRFSVVRCGVLDLCGDDATIAEIRRARRDGFRSRETFYTSAPAGVDLALMVVLTVTIDEVFADRRIYS